MVHTTSFNLKIVCQTLLFALVFRCDCSPCLGQTYPVDSYFTLIRAAENHLMDGHFKEALNVYFVAFEKYDAPFIKEYLQGTYVASILEDKSDFYSLLKNAIRKGAPKHNLEALFSNRFSKDAIYKQIILDFDKYYAEYLSSIDLKLYSIFEDIDVLDQYATKVSIKLDSVLNLDIRKYFLLRDSYMEAVRINGWPDEKTIGIGGVIAGNVFTPKQLEQATKNNNLIQYIKLNVQDSILCKGDEKFVLFGHPTFGTNAIYMNTRKGNGFLWHHLEHLDSILVNFVKEGVDSLKIHPLFFAQALERSQVETYDFMLGMGSEFFGKNLKYNSAKKYDLNDDVRFQFDEKRLAYRLRKLSDEKRLLLQLMSIEEGREIKQLTKKHFKKYFVLIGLFSNLNVG